MRIAAQRPADSTGLEPALRPARPTISLAMIVGECDAATLPAAIASARDLVDEVIVVVDPASTEARAAALAAGASVHDFTWCNDFAAARNAALDHCTSDWILVLDADEVLEVDDVDALFEAIAKRPAIYNLTVQSHLEGDRVNCNDTPRLFPRRETIGYVGAIHETPVDLTGEVKPSHLALARIGHVGYTQAAIANGNKVERNLTILTAEAERRPQDPQLRLYVSQTLHQVNPDAAADQLRIALYLCRLYKQEDAAGCYDQAASDLLNILGLAGLHAQALLEAQAILTWREPTHTSFWCNLGNAQLNCGANELAAASAMKALACRSLGGQQVDQGSVTWMPEGLAGMAMAALGRDEEAIIFLRRALAVGPAGQSPALQATFDRLTR